MNTEKEKPFSLKKHLPHLFFAGLLFTTLLMWRFITKAEMERELFLFNQDSEKTARQIREKLNNYRILLNGAVGVFAASEEVTREEWRLYYEYQLPRIQFPGIEALVFSKVIYADELTQHIQDLHAQGFSEYEIQPPGERKFYIPAVYWEPFNETSRFNIGNDYSMNPVWRSAMELARDKGTVVISKRIPVLYDGEVQSNIVMITPIYHKGSIPGDIEKRRANIEGYVSVIIRIRELIQDILPVDTNRMVYLCIYDGEMDDPTELLYSDRELYNGPEGTKKPLFTKKSTIELYSHYWTFSFESTPYFEVDAVGWTSWIVLALGLVISIFALLLARTEKKTLEKARKLSRKLTRSLQESEERFRRLAENAADIIYRYDFVPERRFTYVNNVVEKITGYTPLDHYRDPDLGYKLVHPDDRHLFEGMFSETDEIGKPITMRWISKDGSIIWTEHHNSPVHDEQGSLIAVEGIARDITATKEAEEHLRESEEKYRLIVENAHDGIEITQDDRIIFTNKQFARMLGYEPQEMIGKKMQDIFTASAREELQERGRWRRAGNRVQNQYETTLHRKDGSIVFVEIKYEISELNNKPATFAMVRDITQRKQAQEKIQIFSTVIQQSPMSIIITDREGTIEFVNPKFSENTGYTFEEAVGNNPRILKSGEHTDEFYQQLWQTITQGKIWKGEICNRTRDGQIFWENATIGPIFNETGEIIHFVGLKEDITQRKNLETQLQQSQKLEAIGRLAGGVAHDFNNLLTVINGYSSLLLNELDQNKSLYDKVEQIAKAGERAGLLTQQLLAFSRKQIIKPINLDLKHFIQDLQKFLFRMIGEDIHIVLNLTDEDTIINADPGQITQVLLNLAVNARDAMPQGGVLTIETFNTSLDSAKAARHLQMQPGEYVVLAVSDTGTGMDKETQKYIFEPFFTTKEQGKGTGLGLSMVYGIIKQHSGFIWVYSEPDKGTTFRIYFPRVMDQNAPVIEQSIAKESYSGKETILLVEDDPVVLEITKEILTGAGYTVHAANSVQIAIKIAKMQQNKINLIISDVVMPKLSGEKLSAQLKPLIPGLKVLFISGYTDEAITRSGILKKGLHFLQKPFSPNELLKKVREILDGKSYA